MLAISAIFFVMFLCNIYLVNMRKSINEVMLRNGIDSYKNLNGIKDLIYIYKATKKEEISVSERNRLKAYFIISILTLFLYFSFAIMIFTVDW
jgi:predicted membrane-bound dolichyl-phosphate-mannose-protein mannosyltransferase